AMPARSASLPRRAPTITDPEKARSIWEAFPTCRLGSRRCGRAGRQSRMPGKRTVFFLSDRTGITAEMLGNSLLTQFDTFEFARVTIPFVDSPERIAEAVRQVNETAVREGQRPVVISSVVDEAMSETI